LAALFENRTVPFQEEANGIDLAKTVFQIHAVDADGATVIRKQHMALSEKSSSQMI
jgi:hypothetical protein